MIKLALAISSGIYIEALTDNIEKDTIIKVVSKLKNQEEIILCLKSKKIDVLFLDSTIPDINISQILKELDNLSVPPGIILHFHEDNKDLLVKALSLGFNCSLGPNSTIDDIRSAAKAVSEGDIWADNKILSAALKKFINRNKINMEKIETHLTNREMDIAKLITEGMSNKTIAKNLFISERTVKVHISNIFKKFGINHRYQLSAGMLKDKDLFEF